MKFNPPSHWIKGQLLDVKRFASGSPPFRHADFTFKVSLMGDEAKNPETLEFASVQECQAFVSFWYAPEAPRA